ncbi:MAG: antibiotic transporter [Phycisphaerae bacterium]|nr:antibiotic transporter [Phycisphaerae bacterium]
MSLASAAILLFVVMDPLGNLPLFAAALREMPRPRRRRVLARELLIALAVLAAFLLTGSYLLATLKISPPALYISGGVILFVISIRMVFPIPSVQPGTPPREPFIVPLAVPLIAGPSAMTTLLILSRTAPLPQVAAALGLAWLAVAAILMLSDVLQRLLGPRGLEALERLMGMLLIVLAVQMFLEGVKAFMMEA